MKTYFCWRCNKKLPFLEEDEWQIIHPLLVLSKKSIMQYRRTTRCQLGAALENAQTPAVGKFKELTGYADMNWLAIYHHRLADMGKECGSCGHLLRTSSASYCANCGDKS